MDKISEPKIFTTCSHVIQNVIYPILFINKLFPFQQQPNIDAKINYLRRYSKTKAVRAVLRRRQIKERGETSSHIPRKQPTRLQRHYIILQNKSSSTNHSNSVTQILYESTICKAKGLAPNFEFEFPDAQPSKFLQFWTWLQRRLSGFS